MNENVDILLKKLEPEIEKKCYEIKKKKNNKIKNIIFIISLIGFTVIPSLLLLMNINVIYFIVLITIILLIALLIKLPEILKDNSKGVCYE